MNDLVQTVSKKSQKQMLEFTVAVDIKTKMRLLTLLNSQHQNHKKKHIYEVVYVFNNMNWIC